jgi:hypothetical protein
MPKDPTSGTLLATQPVASPARSDDPPSSPEEWAERNQLFEEEDKAHYRTWLVLRQPGEKRGVHGQVRRAPRSRAPRARSVARVAAAAAASPDRPRPDDPPGRCCPRCGALLDSPAKTFCSERCGTGDRLRRLRERRRAARVVPSDVQARDAAAELVRLGDFDFLDALDALTSTRRLGVAA